MRIFSPQDGQRLGLPGMINELIAECDTDLVAYEMTRLVEAVGDVLTPATRAPYGT